MSPSRNLGLGALALAAFFSVAACASPVEPPKPSGNGGAGGDGGSGGGGGDDVCDADSDGHRAPSCGGDDCNDRNPPVHPGAEELCSGGLDENCNDNIDEGCACTPGDVRSCY